MSVGMKQTKTGLAAGSNFVLRVPISVDMSSRAQARVFVRDITNNAMITWLDSPKFYGTHDGAGNSATLIDSTNKLILPNVVGWKLYNITDGSSTIVTAYVWNGTNTTITGVLADGTDNDWDDGDVYRLVPPRGYDHAPWVETFTLELPTIARNGVAADCVAVEWGIINLSDGELQVHQCEVYSNLIDNPSMETGAGNPWVPDAWATTNLDAGDSAAEAGMVHSGSGSILFNVGASAEGITQDDIFAPADGFFALGGWGFTDGGTLNLGLSNDDDGERQDGNAVGLASGYPLTSGAAWNHGSGVFRTITAVGDTYLRAAGGATDVRYADDIYAFLCDPVALTATPANEANSLENTDELRVDGDDYSIQLSGVYLTASQGWARVAIRPRHNAADLMKFSAYDPTWLLAWGDAGNFIQVLAIAANTIQLHGVIAAGAPITSNWDCTGLIVADTPYIVEIRYYPGTIELIIDNIVVTTIPMPADFTTAPDRVYWLSEGGVDQADATASAP